MKLKRFKEVTEDAPVNSTGVAVATNEPIVRKKKKKEDSSGREIGTPELLKRYKEDTPGQESAITESAKIRDALKKVKGLSKKQMQFMMTLPTPVLTTMINQLSTLVMGDDDEHPPHVKDKEKEKKKVVLKGSLASVQEARLVTDGKLVTNVSQVLDVIAKKLKQEMGKRYKKNQKDGMQFINSLAKIVGMTASDKNQTKNKMFLRMGEEVECTCEEIDFDAEPSFAVFEGRKVPLDRPMWDTQDEEKNPELNKPKRGGSKKFYVYVKDPSTGNVKKVSFGAKDGGGNLSVKLKDPKARASFAARHNCDQANDKTKASYWACRLPRYAKQLGLSGSGSGWW